MVKQKLIKNVQVIDYPFLQLIELHENIEYIKMLLYSVQYALSHYSSKILFNHSSVDLMDNQIFESYPDIFNVLSTTHVLIKQSFNIKFLGIEYIMLVDITWLQL